MSVRESFVKQFGDEQAKAIEKAAREHGNGVNNRNLGSDPFKWAILICLGYECVSKDAYREYHGITVPFDQLEKWIIEEADLGSHDGDCDYIALLAGVYNKYVKEKQNEGNQDSNPTTQEVSE